MHEVSGSEARIAMIGARRPSHEVDVPVIKRIGPFRFFLYSQENVESHEAPHVHVRSADGEASFGLSPVKLRKARGYTEIEVNRIRALVVDHREEFLRRWYDFFDRQ